MRGIVRGGLIISMTALVLAACSGGSSSSAGRPPASSSSVAVTVTAVAGATTTAPAQTSGTRTVLSPLGLNIRGQASKTAPVLGTVGQGVTLTVLGHNDQGGGWYEVKGATVTGWISDNPTLTSPGKFTPYDSGKIQFSALYPETWNVMEAPPASVVFHPATGGDSIVVTSAATTALLGRGRPGYQQRRSDPVVVCGVTSELITYEQAGSASSTTGPAGGATAQRYLIQVHLTLDPQHALGIDANLGDAAQLPTVRDVVYSVKFPFPQCAR